MEIENLNDQNFDQEVLERDTAVLVAVTTSFSGFSKIVEQKMQDIESDSFDWAIVRADKQPFTETCKKYGLHVAPTLAVFKNGKLIGASFANVPRAKVDSIFENILASL